MSERHTHEPPKGPPKAEGASGPASGADDSSVDVSASMIEPSPADARARSLVGTTLSGRYRIHELIAMGGMGAVYRGEHIHLRKRLAVKVLHPETENLPELVERFRREALVGAHARHPHVAAATDFGTLDDGSYFLVLEHVRGVTLYDVVRRGPLPPARAVHIARQLASALDALHARGIVHRDVKPLNIMLVNPASEAEPRAEAPPVSRGPDFVKLIDFGLATVELDRLPSLEMSAAVTPLPRERLTGTGTIFGTIAYLAPEAALGMDHVDGRGDLYALGIVLYEMLCGRRPFQADRPAELVAQHVSAPPPPFHETAPGLAIPPALEHITRRLLAKDPAERFQRGAEVVAALEEALGDRLTPPPAEPSVPTPLSVPRPDVSDTLVMTPPNGALRSARISANGPPPRAPQIIKAPASPFPFAYVAALVLPVLGAGLYLALSRPKAPTAPPLEPTTAQSAPGSPSSSAATLPNTPPGEASAPRSAPSEPAAPASAAPTASSTTEADLERLRVQVRQASSKTYDYESGRKALVALATLDPPSLTRPNFTSAAVDVITGAEESGKPGTDELFDLLSAPQSAPHGLDLLYDVVHFRGGRKAAKRALALLRTPDIIARASPALHVTFDFREADCPRKEGLAERAVAEGDGRTLLLLKVALGGCGRTPTLEKAYNELLLKLIKK